MPPRGKLHHPWLVLWAAGRTEVGDHGVSVEVSMIFSGQRDFLTFCRLYLPFPPSPTIIGLLRLFVKGGGGGLDRYVVTILTFCLFTY